MFRTSLVYKLSSGRARDTHHLFNSYDFKVRISFSLTTDLRPVGVEVWEEGKEPVFSTHKPRCPVSAVPVRNN